MNIPMRLLPLWLAAVMQFGGQTPAPAQASTPAATGGRGGQSAHAPAFTSPEILPDRRIAFQLFAPDAMSVALRAIGALSGADVRAGGLQSGDEQLIRDVRARSNQAIAAHDLAGIGRAWLPDVHVVSSTSTQTAGREANLQRLVRQFTSRLDTVYVRRPRTIDVYAPWAVASERGEWTGKWTEPDGPLEISGTYLAQWRKVDGQWQIQAELFVPTRCTGAAFCRQHP